MLSKEIACVAAGSVITGGLLGYFLCSRISGKNSRFVSKSYADDASAVIKYVTEISLREPQILEELRMYTLRNVRSAGMITDPLQAQFFRMLLNALEAKKILEVGTYTGYNALNCALSIPSDGMVYALDVSEEFVNHGKPFFERAKVADKIDIKIAPAVVTMDMLIKDGHSDTFDFIYIDADKIGYDSYYERALVLVRKGGMIVLDNMLWGGSVTTNEEKWDSETRAIDALNRKIKLDNRVQISFFNIGDGVFFCRKI